MEASLYTCDHTDHTDFSTGIHDFGDYLKETHLLCLHHPEDAAKLRELTHSNDHTLHRRQYNTITMTTAFCTCTYCKQLHNYMYVLGYHEINNYKSHCC